MRNGKFKSEQDIVAVLRAKIGYGRHQTALADMLGVSRGHMSDLLAGKKSPGRVILKALGYDPTPYYRRSRGLEAESKKGKGK